MDAHIQNLGYAMTLSMSFQMHEMFPHTSWTQELQQMKGVKIVSAEVRLHSDPHGSWFSHCFLGE